MATRIIISAVLGIAFFLLVAFATANLFIGMIVGFVIFVVLVTVTDKNWQKRRRQRIMKREREEKEERGWRRESYHREKGRQIALDNMKRERKMNDYDELDITNILPTKKSLGRWFGGR